VAEPGKRGAPVKSGWSEDIGRSRESGAEPGNRVWPNGRSYNSFDSMNFLRQPGEHGFPRDEGIQNCLVVKKWNFHSKLTGSEKNADTGS
jgi:hypothetical protein